MINIPIYRAKKIDSDEYVEGFYQEIKPSYANDGTVSGKLLSGWQFLIHTESGIEYPYKIDQSTIAIHFPDMLDSEENKIFASLSKCGKGGDTLMYNAGNDFDRYIGNYIFKSNDKNYSVTSKYHWENDAKQEDFRDIDAPTNKPINTVTFTQLFDIKVIGIQK